MTIETKYKVGDKVWTLRREGYRWCLFPSHKRCYINTVETTSDEDETIVTCSTAYWDSVDENDCFISKKEALTECRFRNEGVAP